MSCDVTERYTPRTPSQYCQIKYGGPFVRLLGLQPKVAENPSFEQEEFLCACHSEKQSFGFLKKDPQNQGLFNLSGLSRAATGTNVSLDDGGAEVTDCRRKRKQGKPVYCQHMLHFGISGHFQALANVLKRRMKSVSPEESRCCGF